MGKLIRLGATALSMIGILVTMAKGMAWLKTNFKLAAESSDDAVADFITDGCNMGVKSLSGYLNNYKAADEKSKNIAKELICLEERLSVDMRGYLSAK